VTNNFKHKNCMQPMRRLNMAPIYFLGLQGVKVKEGIFIFLLLPGVLSKFSMSSHDVNTMFSSSFHTVPNDFS
jgi:hypothetical protein